MSAQKRNFSMTDSIAPYRKPVVSSPSSNADHTYKNRRFSFFNRVKSFFQTNGNESLHPYGDGTRGVKPYPVPGGFYNMDAKNSVINLHNKSPEEHNGERHVFSLCPNVIDYNEENPNLSNAKLAEFFREKGDAPLTEMEYEGVMSLIKRSKSVSSTPQSKQNTLPKKASEARVLRSTSERIPGTPLRAPSFKPHYGDSTSLSNISFRSSGSSTTRRVFDYSKLPSPYRTTVYKYSAAKSPKSHHSAKHHKPSENQIRKPSRENKNPKNLSHTASALISLLDGGSKPEIADTGSFSAISNPYSPHVTHINKSKKLTQHDSSDLGGKERPREPSPHKSSALEELATPPPASNNASPMVAPQSQPMLSFKPNKPSSLRVEVTVEKSPEKDPRQPVPQSSTFNFSFDKSAAAKQRKFGSRSDDVNESHNSPFNLQNMKGTSSRLCDSQGKSTQPLQTNQPNSSSLFESISCNSKQMDTFSKLSHPIPEQFLPNFTKNGLGITSQPIHKEMAPMFSASIKYDFGALPSSGVSPSSVKEDDVEKFRPAFIF